MPSIKKNTKTYNSRSLWGKLRVSRMLLKNSATASMAPAAAPFTLKRLKNMTARFSRLYIKPDIGSLGVGIHRLRQSAGGSYELVSTVSRSQTTRYFSTIDSVYYHLKNVQSSGKLFIQQGILLDRFDGKPYDLRVMVQRRPGGSWTCTGMFAKVASPSKIVTNVHQGAKLYMLSRLLELQGLSPSSVQSKISWMESRALAVSRSLSKQYSGMHEMGIDFAIDRSGKLWVIEVNTNHPQFGPIKRLNRTVYNRMLNYARSYGRFDD